MFRKNFFTIICLSFAVGLGCLGSRAKVPRLESVPQAKVRLAIEVMEREASTRARQHWIGWLLKMGCIGGFVLGAIIHLKGSGLSLSGGKVRSIGSSVMSVSGALYVVGVVMHWEADHSKLIECTVMGAFAIFALYLVWRWRYEDGTKLKSGKSKLVDQQGGGVSVPSKVAFIDGSKCPRCGSTHVRRHPNSDLSGYSVWVCQLCSSEWNKLGLFRAENASGS